MSRTLAASRKTKTARRPDRRARRIARHVRLAAAHERALAHDLRKIFTRAGRSAAAHVAAGQGHLAVAVVVGFEPAIAQAFRARLQAAAAASAQLVIEELTGEKASPSDIEMKFLSLFQTAQRAVRDWIGAHAAEKVRRASESLKKLIRESIQRGNDANEPPRALARRIREETGGEIGKARAVVISRTETHEAAQVGSAAAAGATGLALDKEWGATEDNRTRPTHAEADGQLVDRHSDFIVGGERCGFPGDSRLSAKERINCRCVTLWVPRLPK